MRRKKILALVCTLALCLSLSIPASAAETSKDSSTVHIVQSGLSPGYYLCAVWDGDNLLRIFDYTVGSDGKLDTTVEVGRVLEADKDLTVGISNKNAGENAPTVAVQTVKPDPSSGAIKQPGGTTTPPTPSNPNTPSNPSTPDTSSTGSSSSGTSGTSSPSLRPLPDHNATTTTPANPSTNPTTPPTSTAIAFSDVSSSHWAYDAIKWASENHYMNGTSATTFHPDSNISRQQLWMILARLNNQNPANMSEARSWAISNQISDGSNAAQNMSRQQLVTFLYRYCNLKNYAISGSTALSSYPDQNTVSDYAKDALSWAVGNRIMTGTNQGTLNPTGTATRAQFAVILQRFYNSVVDKK